MKIGKWIDNSKEPLEKVEDVQICKPDPLLGQADWQETILALDTGNGDVDLVFGTYSPKRRELLSEYTRITFDGSQWRVLDIDRKQYITVTLYAYYFVPILPNFDNPKEKE